MGETTAAPGVGHYLPQVMLATILVVACPAIIVWQLASTGTIETFIPLVAIGLTVSVAISLAGSAIWKSRTSSKDLLFADLMLWGWLRRWRAERRLDSALTLLDLSGHATRAQLDPDVRIDVLKDLATSLESRDPYTHGHSRRVARYAAMIAEKMELSDDEVNKVRTAAAVHDVGKLEVPLDVLNKPGRLTDEEFDLIKTHAPRGAEMVRNLGDADLTEMVAHHHERLDGSGYPSRLGGSEIPLGARIIAVADTFDALTSTRAYRSAKRHREALGILHAEAGTQLDPVVVEAFDRCYEGSMRGILVWPLLAGLPHRLWAPVESQFSAAGGTAVSKAFTIAATTAATGTIAVGAGTADPRDTSRSEPADASSAVHRTGGDPVAAAVPSGSSVVPASPGAGPGDAAPGSRANGSKRSGPALNHHETSPASYPTSSYPGTSTASAPAPAPSSPPSAPSATSAPSHSHDSTFPSPPAHPSGGTIVAVDSNATFPWSLVAGGGGNAGNPGGGGADPQPPFDPGDPGDPEDPGEGH